LLLSATKFLISKHGIGTVQKLAPDKYGVPAGIWMVPVSNSALFSLPPISGGMLTGSSEYLQDPVEQEIDGKIPTFTRRRTEKIAWGAPERFTNGRGIDEPIRWKYLNGLGQGPIIQVMLRWSPSESPPRSPWACRGYRRETAKFFRTPLKSVFNRLNLRYSGPMGRQNRSRR
jgi:hypothetical protein